MQRINFLYHTPKCLGSGYMGSEGLKRALESNGLLNYAYNQTGGEFLDIEKYQSAPIFIVRGFLNGRMPLVAKGGNQFKAAWQSESYYTRHGEEDSSTQVAVENQHHFNMYFVCAETDLDKYDIPTYWLPSWGDISVFNDIVKPEIRDRLGFYGGKQGREDFLDEDRSGIIDFFRTSLKGGDATEGTLDLCRAINKYEMLISPPGRCYNGMCGRAFEIMACGRLCFQYLNEDTMFEHMKFFEDGVDIVYFRDWAELTTKFHYYLSRPEERAIIANNGYHKVRNFHNQNAAAGWIAECMRVEHGKWLKDQAEIPDEINKLYAEI